MAVDLNDVVILDWSATPIDVVVTSGFQGPPGAPGAGYSHYVHPQLAPSTHWTVVHDLGRYPQVAVVDSANTVVYGEVHYLDLDSVLLIFSASFSGTAYLG